MARTTAGMEEAIRQVASAQRVHRSPVEKVFNFLMDPANAFALAPDDRADVRGQPRKLHHQPQRREVRVCRGVQ